MSDCWKMLLGGRHHAIRTAAAGPHLLVNSPISRQAALSLSAWIRAASMAPDGDRPSFERSWSERNPQFFTGRNVRILTLTSDLLPWLLWT